MFSGFVADIGTEYQCMTGLVIPGCAAPISGKKSDVGRATLCALGIPIVLAFCGGGPSAYLGESVPARPRRE